MLELTSDWTSGIDRYDMQPLPFNGLCDDDRLGLAARYLSTWFDVLYATKHMHMLSLHNSASNWLAPWGGIKGIYDMPTLVWLSPVKSKKT